MQLALLVNTQLTTSPLANAVVVKVSLLLPVALPLSSHWYKGAVPPFTGIAEKVTASPGQISFADAVILTAGTINGSTAMMITLLVAVVGTAHWALLVRIHVILSPFARVALVKVLLLAPAVMPFTDHL